MKAIPILTKILAAVVMLGCFTQYAFAANAMHIVINNHLGAPEMLIDENRHVVWQAEYDEFGKATILVEEVEFNHRLPGQYYDKETGLHYNYYRDYDPSLGRYVQSDPIGILKNYSDPQMQVAMQQGIPLRNAGNNQVQLNHVYGYVGQNPVNLIDPFGLCDITCQIANNAAGIPNDTPAEERKKDCVTKCIVVGTASDEAQAQGMKAVAEASGKKGVKVFVKAFLKYTGIPGFIWMVYQCSEDCSDCENKK